MTIGAPVSSDLAAALRAYQAAFGHEVPSEIVDKYAGRCGPLMLLDPDVNADFYLTQIVSHHQAYIVATFLAEGEKHGLQMPGVFGVFYYRSANEKTLRMLNQFVPVPVEGLLAEFASGDTPVDICARTIRVLRQLGVRHFYLSNLPHKGTASVLKQILERAEG